MQQPRMDQAVEAVNRDEEKQDVITKNLLERSVSLKTGQNNIKIKDVFIPEACGGHGSLSSTVRVNALEGNKPVSHNLFIKVLPKKKIAREAQKTKLYFLKEAMAYSDIIPDMVRCQTELELDPFGPSVPVYYNSLVDDVTGIIILEDVRQYNYLMADRRKGLDYKHCRLVMKELAVFHALSFAIKKRKPAEMKNYKRLFQESIITEPLPPVMTKGFDASIQFIKAFSEDNEIIKCAEKLHNMDVNHTLTDLIKPTEPYSLICHGDLWYDNMVFRYNGTLPEDVKFLDLQMVRYALPTTDLAFFFFSSTTKQLRSKYMKDLLFLYYSVFKNSLRKSQLDFPEFILPVLEELFEGSKLFGIMCAIMFSPPTGQPSSHGEIPKNTANTEAEFDIYLEGYYKEIYENEHNVPILKERLTELMEDIIQLGVI